MFEMSNMPATGEILTATFTGGGMAKPVREDNARMADIELNILLNCSAWFGVTSKPEKKFLSAIIGAWTSSGKLKKKQSFFKTSIIAHFQ